MPDIPSKFSERFVHNFLSYLANRQTNRQTKSAKNITSLAEVIITKVKVKVKVMFFPRAADDAAIPASSRLASLLTALTPVCGLVALQ